MTPLHEILDREAERISAPLEALNAVLDLKDRRERRHRVEAIAVVAIICGALAVGAGLVNPFGAAPASRSPDYHQNGDIAVFQEHIVDGQVHARVVTVDPVSGRSTTLPIRSVDIAGSHRTTQPSWSPDGSSLAYLLANRLWILDPTTGQSRELARCLPEPCSGSPSWSPDGSTIAVTDEGPPGRILLFDANSGQASTISPIEASGTIVEPTWSPDGGSIAFIFRPVGPSGRSTGELYTVRRDGSQVRSLARHAWIGLAWSPDGSTIAYLSEPSETSTKCHEGSCPITAYVVDAASSIERPLVRAGECLCLTFVPGIAWSPDGTQLALVMPGTGRKHPSGLYTVSPDGSGLRLVLQGGWGQPSWRAVP